MYTQQTTSEGDCIDNGYLSTAFDNLEFLNECINGPSTQVMCSTVDESGTGRLTTSFGDEVCFPITARDPLISPASVSTIPEQKILILTRSVTYSARYNDSDNPGQITRRAQITLRCDGQTIATLQSSNSLDFFEFECLPNTDVEICVQASQNNAGSAILQSDSTFTAKICGSLLCFESISNALAANSNYMPLPAFRPECKYGRDIVHLINQNLNALTSTLSASGQVASCDNFAFTDSEDHVLLNTAPTDTTFLILGQTCVTGTNASTGTPATISVKPRFTCDAQQLSCNTGSATIPATGGDGPTTRTVCVDVALCGTCAAGETLKVALRSEFVCGEAQSQVVAGSQSGITSIRQNYCVFFFSALASNLDDISTSLGRCIDVTTFEAINDRMAALAATCESRRPVEFGSDIQSGIAGRGDCVVVKPPEPWPPLNDPTNPNPAPTAKRYMVASVIPRITNAPGLNTEELSRVRASAEILCGGTTLALGFREWTVASSGGRPILQGQSMQFSQCVECPIDQPITVCFDSQRIAGFAPPPDEFEYSFRFFSFF